MIKVFLFLFVFFQSLVLFSEEDVEKIYDQYSSPKKEDLSYSRISQLELFKDIAVIQRKFLPKSQRFEMSLNVAGVINNAFFTGLGASVKTSYYFSDRLSLEGFYTHVSSQEKQATKNLKDLSTQAETLVSMESLLGGALKWEPIYGKIAWLKKRIIPFDLGFKLSGGQVKTAADSSSFVSVGTYQTFAWSKRTALRWDLDFVSYKAKDSQNVEHSQEDLLFSVGVSWFFPEASYR